MTIIQSVTTVAQPSPIVWENPVQKTQSLLLTTCNPAPQQLLPAVLGIQGQVLHQ